MIGGGVTEELLPSIVRLSPALSDVHVGRAARRDGEVAQPVDERKVAAIRHQLDQALL
jgi:predicted TIM-barrel enzyme